MQSFRFHCPIRIVLETKNDKDLPRKNGRTPCIRPSTNISLGSSVWDNYPC